MTKIRTCPLCERKYKEEPAISRFDNKTKICPECGMIEALAAWVQPGFKGYDPKIKPDMPHGRIVGERMEAYHNVTVYEDGHEEKDYIGD